jgi:hypothetical protein
MVGAARRKIDTQTQQMFDSEVDKPEHDKILTKLFDDEATLKRLFMERHKVTMLEPFTPASKFAVHAHGPEYDRTPARIVTYDEAVQLTGVEPVWRDLHPIRVRSKVLEAMMTFSNDDGRYSRIVGFVDICVGYTVATMPYIANSSTSRDNKYIWSSDPLHAVALIEVKSAWPTAGNLLRQLNIYSNSTARGGVGNHRLQYVVGPDSSVNELVNQHGWRTVTFDQNLDNFTLVPGTIGRKPVKDVAGAF